jgi:hypothetical protein
MMVSERKAKMSTGLNEFKGVVHGNLIELDHPPGLPDGQEVKVTVEPMVNQAKLPRGEGLRRSAGAWAEDAEELDKFLEWNRQRRKIGRREIEQSKFSM